MRVSMFSLILSGVTDLARTVLPRGSMISKVFSKAHIFGLVNGLLFPFWGRVIREREREIKTVKENTLQ